MALSSTRKWRSSTASAPTVPAILLSRLTADAFYHLMSALSVKIVFNHADCCLMSRRALQALFEYPRSIFARDCSAYRIAQATVGYACRPTSETHYPLRMLMLAWMASPFSIRPIG